MSALPSIRGVSAINEAAEPVQSEGIDGRVSGKYRYVVFIVLSYNTHPFIHSLNHTTGRGGRAQRRRRPCGQAFAGRAHGGPREKHASRWVGDSRCALLSHHIHISL
jgi:hypothetical protein